MIPDLVLQFIYGSIGLAIWAWILIIFTGKD